jgi:hypothetical protein
VGYSVTKPQRDFAHAMSECQKYQGDVFREPDQALFLLGSFCRQRVVLKSP